MPIIISGTFGTTIISGSSVTWPPASSMSGAVWISGSLTVSSSNTITNYGSFVSNEGAGDNDFRVESVSNGSMFFVDAGNDAIGVATDIPKVALDVHHTGGADPTNLSNDEGGGAVVYFGTASAALVAGGVYYLNQGSGWQSVNSANTGSGHNQLLGISLGTSPNNNGMLIHGFFDVNGFYSGSFVAGGPMYIQSSSTGRDDTGGGYLSGAAPTAGNAYVRVVGYGTDTANVIYFNPDATYVEIAEEE